MELVSIQVIGGNGPYHNRRYIKIEAHFKCPICGDIVTPHSWRTFTSTICGRHKNLNPLKHGLVKSSGKHPLYIAWKAIKGRCLNPKNRRFKDYGGRGIKVCKQWLNDAEAFVRWGLRHGWKEGLEIDRKNNNSDYTPRNCRFVTCQIQNQNRRSTKLTVSKARKIRKRFKLGESSRSLAKRFSIGRRSVYAVINKTTWKNA